MKILSPLRLSLVSGLFLLAIPRAAFAQPYELATLLGTANAEMPFVREMEKNHVALAPGQNFVDLTTGVLYFASRNGVRTAETIQVLGPDGNATLAQIENALTIASRDAALVLVPLAGADGEGMCQKMAELSASAFLVTLGEPGYTLSPLETRCAAPNILFVTTLNQDLSDLGEYASYGPLVRLATPGMDLSAPVAPGRNAAFLSDAFGMAVAAGKLTELARRSPSLRGATLVKEFLDEAETLPALDGKIPGSKAILKFAR